MPSSYSNSTHRDYRRYSCTVLVLVPVRAVLVRTYTVYDEIIIHVLMYSSTVPYLSTGTRTINSTVPVPVPVQYMYSCTAVLVHYSRFGNTGTVNLARLCHLACQSVRLCRHYAQTWRLCRRSFSAAIMPKLCSESGDGPKCSMAARYSTF